MPIHRGDVAFDHSLTIRADPVRVTAAFFDPVALNQWWQTIRSVTTPRPLGVYAVQWEPTPFRDETLGVLGGTLYGTVMEFRPGREFFVADLRWLPPEGNPIGPMALEVTCKADRSAVRLRIRQTGCEDDKRWRRYYEIISTGWPTSLEALKAYLERNSPAAAGGRRAGR